MFCFLRNSRMAMGNWINVHFGLMQGSSLCPGHRKIKQISFCNDKQHWTLLFQWLSHLCLLDSLTLSICIVKWILSSLVKAQLPVHHQCYDLGLRFSRELHLFPHFKHGLPPDSTQHDENLCWTCSVGQGGSRWGHWHSRAWLCHRHSYVFFRLFIPVVMTGEGMREIGGIRHRNDRRRKGMKSTHYMSRQKDW